MIKVRRYSPEDVGVDEDLIQSLKDETSEAQKHYDAELKKYKQDNTYEIQSFTFKTYGKTKGDLIKVFNRKCAYCESSILQGQPGDVEHFRPKSAVDTRLDGIENLSNKVKVPPPEKEKIKPGYYWLAADWYNLLLSCNSCNRKSKQLNADKNTATAVEAKSLEKETLGKGTRFPFVDVKRRIADPKVKISKEKNVRLLIDPGEDDPEVHLTFVKHIGRKNTLIDAGKPEVEEKFGMIKALTDKGLASIQIFGLARLSLVQEREKAATQLMRDLTDLKQGISQLLSANKELKANPNNTFAKGVKQQAEDRVNLKMRSLIGQFKNTSSGTAPSQYLGMKRAMLRGWLKEENTIVADLKKLEIDIERLLVLDLLKELNFIRHLVRDYRKADQANDSKIKTATKSILKKVWKELKAELKPNTKYLDSKKSLLQAWINGIERKEKPVMDTLKVLQLDPTKL